MEMGFSNKKLNIVLLEKFKGSLEDVLDVLAAKD